MRTSIPAWCGYAISFLLPLCGQGAEEPVPLLPRYDFGALVDSGASDQSGGGNAWVMGAGVKESADTFSPPAALRLDAGKAKQERVVSAAFYLLGAKLEPFKGRPLRFSARIKWLSGSGRVTAQMRCNHVDDKGQWSLVTASQPAPFSGAKGTWEPLELRCMIPAAAEVNGANFVIWLETSPEPPVILIDDPVVEVAEAGPATGRVVRTFAAYEAGAEGPLELVRQGVAVARIVTTREVTPTVQYAVRELNEHLALCTGVPLPVITDEAAWPGPAVHIGRTALTQRLGLTPELLPPDTWVVWRVGQALILAGGDNAHNLSPVGKELAPFGTLYATYEFLERALGVRWYWPGDLGRVTPKTATVSVGEVHWQGAPSYETRFAWYSNIKDPAVSPAECQAWWRRLRWGGLGGSPIGMHSFNDWNKRFGKDHPEWFALQRNGQRLSSPEAAGNECGHLCWTNPDVLAATVAEKRSQFDKAPHIAAQSVMPGDSDGLYQCQCDGCRARFDLEAGPAGRHSRVVWSFVNQVAAQVRQSHPDRLITCGAYASYRDVPEDVPFEPNVAVSICDGSFPGALWRPDLKEAYVRQIEAWSRKSSRLYIWDYWNNPRYQKGLHGAPSVMPHAIQEWLLLERGRVRGHSIELCDIDHDGLSVSGWADWIYDALNVYVGMRLLWDLDQDVDAIVEEFYTAFYGPVAGPHLRRFYSDMETAYTDPATKGPPEVRWDFETCWTQTYPPEFVGRVMGHLRTAEQASRDTEPYHSRVARTLAGFLPFEQASQRWSSARTRTVANSALEPTVATAAPLIDGRLDDACWAGAAEAKGFVDSFNSADVRAHTSLRFLRDPATLFVAVRAELPQGTAKRTLPPDSVDQWVWENESCELFFVEGVKKVQFIVGPDNLYADNFHPDLNTTFSMDLFKWNCVGVAYKSVTGEKEWTAELAIPLASLGLATPTRAAPWRVNFGRNYYFRAEPDDKTKLTWQLELSTWRPTFGSFHNVETFGQLWWE